MKIIDHDGVTLYDLEPPVENFRDEVLRGLLKPAKTLSPKYFYDDRGARLFEEICELPEYYPTRTETAILRDNGTEIASLLGAGCLLVEFGSGASTKVRILLDHLDSPAAYVPIDVAKSQLVETAAALAKSYPRLRVLPVCGDYMSELSLPLPEEPVARIVAFFPGSTVGNLEPKEVDQFLSRVAVLCGPSGRFLIGVDLRKDRSILEPAYNDARGVTGAFNLNILDHINRQLGGNFDLDGFRHKAIYNEKHGRIEMLLVSLRRQTVRLGEVEVSFEQDEPITTEYSYKYTLDGFRAVANAAGFEVGHVWTDAGALFSVQLLHVLDADAADEAIAATDASENRNGSRIPRKLL